MGLAVKKEEIYTYQDYLAWPDEERWEIIDGVAYDMSPAPRIRHQKIVVLLARKIGDKVEEKGCTLLLAPTDVVFDEYNVVQPDVIVVCARNKITEANIQGAPDLIVEVLSPGTELKDKREKRNLYERFGVAEYIIIYPAEEYIERFCLADGKYTSPEIFNWDEAITLCSLELEIKLWEIFEKKRGDIN